MKYTLFVNKNTGARSLKINKTGEIVSEVEDPERYSELRKRAVKNQIKAERDSLMESFGLTKVKGNLGGTYWE